MKQNERHYWAVSGSDLQMELVHTRVLCDAEVWEIRSRSLWWEIGKDVQHEPAHPEIEVSRGQPCRSVISRVRKQQKLGG
jgi:hypothetical protein